MSRQVVRGLVASLVALVIAGAADAGQIGRDGDLLRTGWYSNQPGLSPGVVTGPNFGQQFSTAVTGAVYAQPLVWNGILLVVTQANWIYGMDPYTGAVKWSRNVGTPWNASDIAGCTDITPVVGITSTPVIDDSTGIAYFTNKQYRTSSSSQVQWKMHSISVATGAEQTGFPVTISGSADNAPGESFTPKTHNQRTGLLLMNGVVYAGFSSVCDTDPWQGWIIGVSTAGAITARWVDRIGSGGGIWMAGSGLVSDAPGQMLFATGNGSGGGTPASPIPGSSPPAELCESIVRLQVQGNGSLQPIDFFTPWNSLADYDPIDADLGSGGVTGLPPPTFGTPAHTQLYAQVGKPGIMYLLDGSSLGGYQQAPDGTDAVVQEIDTQGGVWSKPSVWGGDGGWVYVETGDTTLSADGAYGWMRAFQYGLDGSGNPTLTLAGSSPDRFGFASSTPIVTSNGTTSGSALLWVVWNPPEDFSGVGAEMRAYDPVPVDGTLQLRWSAPVGTGSKFNPPGVFAGRLYVGTRDGNVLCFGPPVGASAGDHPGITEGAQLSEAYPNPARSATSMRLTLAREAHVRLTIYDPSGRRVRRLADAEMAAGTQRMTWDVRDDQGLRVANGLYLVRLDAADTRLTRRVLVVH